MNNKGRILLAHGGGGSRSTELTRGLFQRYLRDPLLLEMDDAARLPGQAFTTDSFVVRPLFFPGGDIGRLAVCGTVNDLAVMGAEPLYLSIGFIIEEGFPIADLERVLASIARACREAGVRIVCADTKVVERGKADGLFINTAGIGRPAFRRPVLAARVKPGDAVLISGPIGLHGIAVLTARGEFGLKSAMKSDVAPLWGLVRTCRGLDVPFMRDPTRGGLAQTLNELVQGRKFGVRIDEAVLPVPRSVAAVCDLLGLDPLQVANEGKVVMVVAAGDAEKALLLLHRHRLGRGARRIGEISRENRGRVVMATRAGSERIVMPPAGEILPRIC
ncbi:MAG TPA: hydrogenase expression/formation protein HypE [Candidatus Aminicenantes bacterium]|nr:hydrogenase expression/formation protein HypE [Candidatus Aminicenantes bacterium]